MEKKSYRTQTSRETKRLGKVLGDALRSTKTRKHAFIIALSGDLGAGKTLFVCGLALGLGIRTRVSSPTFILARRHAILQSSFKNLWHIDCYRMERASELSHINFSKISKDPGNIIAIEWAEKIRRHIPKDALWITIDHAGQDERAIVFKI
jgi:tRNA threonylcarbamoyladenosine biosynthesis protein TsaE